MESTKTYVVVWLWGFFTGLILLERWRRFGSTAESGGEIIAAEMATTTTSGATDKLRVSVFVQGAKADAARARDLLRQMMPWARNSAAGLAETTASVPPRPAD